MSDRASSYTRISRPKVQSNSNIDNEELPNICQILTPESVPILMQSLSELSENQLNDVSSEKVSLKNTLFLLLYLLYHHRHFYLISANKLLRSNGISRVWLSPLW